MKSRPTYARLGPVTLNPSLVILNPSLVILNPSLVILNPSLVILNEVKDLASTLRVNSVKDLNSMLRVNSVTHLIVRSGFTLRINFAKGLGRDSSLCSE